MTGDLYRPPQDTPELRGQLDLSDSIDMLVAEFKQKTPDDPLFSSSVQNSLVANVQFEKPNAANQLVAADKWLIAAVAHRFKNAGVENKLLMRAGAMALVYLAQIYIPDEHGSFIDQAILEIEAELESITNNPPPKPRGNWKGTPIDRIFRYTASFSVSSDTEEKVEETSEVTEAHGATAVSVVTVIPKSQAVEAAAKTDEIPRPSHTPESHETTEVREVLKDFTEMEQKVLPLLFLSNSEIAKRLSIPPYRVKNIVTRARAKLDPKPPTATDLAMELYRRGLRFDIKTPTMPLVELLTNEEMEVAKLLGLPYGQVAEKMNSTPNHIDTQVRWMRQKTGARTRTELALMVLAYDTGERRPENNLPPSQSLAGQIGLTSLQGYDIDELLRPTTPRQRQAITAYHLGERALTWQELGDELGTNPIAAYRLVQRGVNNMRKARQST